MRLKTFFATLLLFLILLFSLISVISVYTTNSQINALRERSQREYRTISSGLSRNISVLQEISLGLPEEVFFDAVESFFFSYAMNYREYLIEISLTNLSDAEDGDDIPEGAVLSFIEVEGEHFIHITGRLAQPFEYFQLDYYINITNTIIEVQNIQHILLLISIPFSIIAALGLYYILMRLFKPIDIITRASQKIAGGSYEERIPVEGNNELATMAINFNQMAEEIERQLQLSRDEAIGKQQFIDNFAHEIRTPLTSIYGYAEYIQKAPYDEDDILESTESIMDRANHMKEIANSLLKLATLRNYKPVIKDIAIQPFFEDIERTLRKAAHEENPQLIFESNVEILKAQEDLIKILLLNLCINGIKSCEMGKGIIHVEARGQAGDIFLSVTDNGCGISDEDIKRIAEPFYRVDKTRHKNFGGTGLGLTLCQQIVQVHEARMIMESSIGVGTRVTIIFTNS